MALDNLTEEEKAAIGQEVEFWNEKLERVVPAITNEDFLAAFAKENPTKFAALQAAYAGFMAKNGDDVFSIRTPPSYQDVNTYGTISLMSALAIGEVDSYARQVHDDLLMKETDNPPGSKSSNFKVSVWSGGNEPTDIPMAVILKGNTSFESVADAMIEAFNQVSGIAEPTIRDAVLHNRIAVKDSHERLESIETADGYFQSLVGSKYHERVETLLVAYQECAERQGHCIDIQDAMVAVNRHGEELDLVLVGEDIYVPAEDDVVEAAEEGFLLEMPLPDGAIEYAVIGHDSLERAGTEKTEFGSDTRKWKIAALLENAYLDLAQKQEGGPTRLFPATLYQIGIGRALGIQAD